jgi:hypothetical protein
MPLAMSTWSSWLLSLLCGNGNVNLRGTNYDVVYWLICLKFFNVLQYGTKNMLTWLMCTKWHLRVWFRSVLSQSCKCTQTESRNRHLRYKVVQIWPGRFVCKQVTVCPGHIWTTLYFNYKVQDVTRCQYIELPVFENQTSSLWLMNFVLNIPCGFVTHTVYNTPTETCCSLCHILRHISAILGHHSHKDYMKLCQH